MLEKIMAVVQKFNMISLSDNVVVGVSGGADSIALLHIMKRLSLRFSFNLVAAHLNHMLRGDDAEQDEEYVVLTCKKWEVTCFTKRTDVKELAKKFKMSEEEAGRKARFEFFQGLMYDIKANKLALGHHKDDRVETIFHNIIRGTGTHGLNGINYVRDGFVIRPLLDVSKEEILQYCLEENIGYREDLSNKNLSYMRNRLRHVLIPFIQDNFNPNITETILRMSDVIGEEDRFLENYCNELSQVLFSYDKDQAKVALDRFNPLHLALKRRLLRMIILGFTGEFSCIELVHIDNIIHMLQNAKQGAAFKLPDKIRVDIKYGHAFISIDSKKIEIEPFEYALNLPGSVFVQEASVKISSEYKEKSQISLGKNPIHIDADKLYGSLVIRSRRSGDKFKPLGMSSEKKLKEFFIDWKIPREERNLIPLITDSRNIIWVAGYQISEDYKVTDRTTRVIELKLVPATDEYEIGEIRQ
jgi:tRNA(Ile)-lysidine synthase